MAEVLPRRNPEHDVRSEDNNWDDSDTDTVEVFSEDEDDELDTTAAQHAAGKDVQGIPWERLHFSREQYRETRLSSYNNYTNLEEQCKAGMRKLGAMWDVCGRPAKGGKFYDFYRNYRAVHSTIVHFQLRNLVWATSAHDVYSMQDSCINHWSSLTRSVTRVMHLAGGSMMGPSLPLGRVQVSTMAAGCGLLAAGGFTGELALKNLQSQRQMYNVRLTSHENGITNGLEIFAGRSGAPRVMCSNNDSALRTLDAATLKCISRVDCPWAVNFASVQPGGGALTAVVGDAPEALLLDWASGKSIARLEGHFDYSFASAWHPNGHILATGNQDTTTRVWDVRMLGVGSLAVLPGRIGAIRSLHFSPSGRHLAVAEPADFVTLYDVDGGYATSQEIDLFGEIAGTAFSPDGDRFFCAVADLTYSSLLEYHLADHIRDEEAGLR